MDFYDHTNIIIMEIINLLNLQKIRKLANIIQKKFNSNNNWKMQEFFQKIRIYFNIVHKDDFLSLTLINPNLDLDIINEIKNTFRLMHHIKKQEIVIIESVNFDDELLEVLADALPQSLLQLSLDFTGCQSLKGSGFLHLFQRISNMSLKKLKLDFSQVYDINDIVIQGLTMLLQSLQELQDFYLDLYEIDQVTEEGYLVLAQCFTSLKQLKHLHLDFSANPNLTEDCLQLLFTNLPTNLTIFEFRILDIDHIGGGSFFGLGKALTNMQMLQKLSLTISTFSNINQKGIFSIIKPISKMTHLKSLQLNFSNIKLAQKLLSYLVIPSNVQNLNLDISCNSEIKDTDMISLANKMQNIRKLYLNIDFCKLITQDSLQLVLQNLLKNGKCIQLILPDRKFSDQFVNNLIKHSLQAQFLLTLNVNQPQNNKNEWITHQKYLEAKRNNVLVIKQCRTQEKNRIQINSILSLLN